MGGEVSMFVLAPSAISINEIATQIYSGSFRKRLVGITALAALNSNNSSLSSVRATSVQPAEFIPQLVETSRGGSCVDLTTSTERPTRNISSAALFPGAA